MIRLEDVHLTLRGGAGPVPILRGVALSVARGESVGLMGPSGSGKSTLMAVIAGLEIADRGRVVVAGQDLTPLDEDARSRFRRTQIGIVFQSFHLIPTMTAVENVALPLELAGAAEPFAQAESDLAAVGLQDRLQHYPVQLSGGEQQRVALARAVAARPPLLLADEPTGNLDGATGAAVIDLLFRLRRQHAMTLLLITHDPVLAGRCDRVVGMADGRTAAAEARGLAAG